jgi:UDP-N-acetylmuramate--alanine ligase
VRLHHKVTRIHLVGIGGSGMCGIAEVLLNLGYRVSGSDLAASPVIDRLRGLGATISIGHAPEHVGDVQVVVRSTAVKDDNPEIEAAHARAIPVIPRAEMLAELMRLKYGVAVAGTHGKTSTTSMIATMLADSDLDPTIVIGGRLNSIDSNARLGRGEVMVVEADESDGSFLALSPIIAVITNIDREHLDHYTGGLEEIEAAFVSFANRVPFYGLVVLCLDDWRVQEIMPRISRRVCTYGFSPQADIRAVDVRIAGLESSFTVLAGEREHGRVSISLPGRHYVQNALAAIATGFELGLEFSAISRNLAAFSGVQRRMQVVGTCGRATVIDDYGHHPTEIRVTLAALRQAYPGWRLVVVFQPHRYSRTRHLFNEFVVAFNEADALLVCPIYAAGEAVWADVSGAMLADEIRQHGHKHVAYRETVEEQREWVRRQADDEHTLVLTLGAGDITRLAHMLVENG